jgi:RNA ligase
MYGPYADLAALDERVDLGYISRKVNPANPDILLYNYSPACQYAQAWDEHTMQARGLVVQNDGLILARPLQKFFNLEQIKDRALPWDQPLEITTKMDGSCIIHCNGITVTRGSFESTQSKWAKELLEEYNPTFDPTITYIMELIHPNNRIVVDYGGERKLVLLAMIETATGREVPLDYNLGIEVVQFHNLENIADGSELHALEKTNEEGFVVRFHDNSRVKVKFAEYCRMHRIVTGTSSKTVWQALRDKLPMNEWLEHVPDEFYNWVTDMVKDLQYKYYDIESLALEIYADAKNAPTRKEQAAIILKQCAPPVSGVVFAMLDGKDYSTGIWKQIEPEFSSPFASRENI